MKPTLLSAALISFALSGRLQVVALSATLLAACMVKTPGSTMPDRRGASTEPLAKVLDYQRVDCASIWDVEEDKLGNALYWLRAMDCAARLSPAEARAEARRQATDSWQGAFREGVLLANGNVTPVERRQYMLQLDSVSRDTPTVVRALLQLWREDQLAQLQLSEERTRYHHLQQECDLQLDALRQQQLTLKEELKMTRRKLETLTDIERQLSTRHSADNADTSQTEKNGVGTKEEMQP